jgi:hypothetical protein
MSEIGVPLQPFDATHAFNLSVGVSNASSLDGPRFSFAIEQQT